MNQYLDFARDLSIIDKIKLSYKKEIFYNIFLKALPDVHRELDKYYDMYKRHISKYNETYKIIQHSSNIEIIYKMFKKNNLHIKKAAIAIEYVQKLYNNMREVYYYLKKHAMSVLLTPIIIQFLNKSICVPTYITKLDSCLEYVTHHQNNLEKCIQMIEDDYLGCEIFL